MKDSQCLVFKRDRLETFNTKWKDLGFKFCTPENFAEAGFYNCNIKTSTDTVKCFSCHVELCDWEEDDDPWQEHIKRRSKCPFVIYKSKKQPTLQDFLELQYESKKILLTNHFELQRKNLLEMETNLLKKMNEFQKLIK